MTLGKNLGCPLSPPADLEACLQKADPQRIVFKQYEVFTQPSLLLLPFLPHVDNNFLPEEPEVGVCVYVCVCVLGWICGSVSECVNNGSICVVLNSVTCNVFLMTGQRQKGLILHLVLFHTTRTPVFIEVKKLQA